MALSVRPSFPFTISLCGRKKDLEQFQTYILQLNNSKGKIIAFSIILEKCPRPMLIGSYLPESGSMPISVAKRMHHIHLLSLE